jgi:metal-responsive CopG/Arc/MetJ family transcriptional regulator
MKTAISIPDEVFREAEQLARRRGISRSELYTTAIRHYVQEERFMGVREQLDAVYCANPAESKLDPLLRDLQTQVLPDENW